MSTLSLPFSPRQAATTIAKLAGHVAIFAAAECLLNVAGVDTLADYYEFLNSERDTIVMAQNFANPGLVHEALVQSMQTL
jgi:hypothetical protein